MNNETSEAVVDVDTRTTAEIRRVFTGMQDALTDEMVGRLAETLSQSAALLDQLGRSGADRAIAQFAQMQDNGDLARLAQLVRVVSAAQDAVTDEMIARLTELLSGAMTLIDRLNRTGLDALIAALPGLLAVLERVEQEHLLEDLSQSLDQATALAATTPPATGGFKGLWQLVREPETQEALGFLLLFSRQFRASRVERQETQRL